MKHILIATLLLLSASLAHAATVELTVNGLVCGFCAQGIEKTLRKNPATQDVFVSLEQRIVAVTLKPGQDIGDADLTHALTDAGYTVTAIARSETSLEEIRERVRAKQ